MLDQFIVAHRDVIIARCRAKVGQRAIPLPSAAEIDHGVPAFLNQLVDALRLGPAANRDIARTALMHGHDLLRQGLSVSQVVHDYGDVCQSITELALELNAPINATDFQTLNQCLDDAIASAVTQYGDEQNRSSVDRETTRGSERLGFFAHELRNLTNTAMVAFEILKTGNVGATGSTSAVLQRSLTGLTTLISRSLAEVRLTQGVQNREPIEVFRFVDEIGAAAALDATANARGITLIVSPVEDGISIVADRQILFGVVMNLLQNAFKFTRPNTSVTLRVWASDLRVLIEVGDECGGLPEGKTDDLFRPFEQRSADRTGLGLGLAFSRWGAETSDGRISTRNLPGHGCVFIIDLPRAEVPANAPSLATG